MYNGSINKGCDLPQGRTKVRKGNTMKVLNITTSKANFATGKFERTNSTAVVASTKSENNLLEELRKDIDANITYTVKDLFLDKSKVLDGVNNLVDEQIKDVDIAKAVKEHIAKVLDGGCIFYKPIIRKK